LVQVFDQMSREPLRLAYLEAMGIQGWEVREAPSATIPEPEEPATEPRVPAAEPFGDDVAHLGWDALEARVAACTACQLHQTRTQTVFGVGNREADLMLIGEAPGADEDRQGEPFVGKAGRLLNEMLHAVGYRREQVYIANILKCRPPNNRDPQPSEVELCEGYLRRQVQLIQPKLIIALGRIAAHNLLKTQTSLARLRGQVHRYGQDAIPVVVTYHPAYLLRSPGDKRKAWKDLLLACDLIEKQ
jgi:uracil-DNA glycosylase family 4